MHEAQPRLGLHVFEHETGVEVYEEELLIYDLVGPGKHDNEVVFISSNHTVGFCPFWDRVWYLYCI